LGGVHLKLKIGVIKGDGIGPEIVTEGIKVLEKVAMLYNHEIEKVDLLLGGSSIDVHGIPLTEETISLAKECQGILMGSIGGNPDTSPWYQLPAEQRPEAGLLKIRKALNLYTNIRPAILYKSLKQSSPLKEEIIPDGFNLVIIRELTGGLYFGERYTEEIDGVITEVDQLEYSENEIRRVAISGFEIAMKRNKHLMSVDKANVLDSSRLWRKIVNEVHLDYPEVKLEHMLVDNCAMQLVKDPNQFDVILTENMFGDILSDEASMLTGSIGMLPSGSLNETNFGLFEPSGGSAPDIAGQGIANPIATILSVAMMLQYTFNLSEEAKAIEQAVEKVLAEGYRTKDIYSEGDLLLNTAEMGDKIALRIEIKK
jgi:3-isopropylmalate dehydrogenase